VDSYQVSRLKGKVAKLEERRIAVEGSLEDAVAELRAKKILVKKLTDTVDDLIERVENLEGRSTEALRAERGLGIVRDAEHSLEAAVRHKRELYNQDPPRSSRYTEDRGYPPRERPRLDCLDEVHTRRNASAGEESERERGRGYRSRKSVHFEA